MLPYHYENLDDAIDGEIHWNCIFVRDCGPFKKGEKVGCLQLQDQKGLLVEYNPDGRVERQVHVHIVARD